ncbi:FtsL-like putative cell division protein [Phaeocystidibacter luteus]|uniref:S-adenosyl-methyltransferase n=1 Tax=Phaeocystidibacter luteus TaxID=911197 RepID=A0A6N6RH87_9FLAO|nr:FtsL-like putative cell division protein [Phaeocystidibacter luteus]KAB2813663.1 S-adenosyl-methyltransferase [Phaeocystidibacter luteus]
MSKIGDNIGAFLRGSFLANERVTRHFPLMVYILLLSLVAIYSAHSADRKVHRIQKLQTQVDELESEHHDTKSRLMQLGLESKVEERVAPLGLETPEHPPVKLRASDD